MPDLVEYDEFELSAKGITASTADIPHSSKFILEKWCVVEPVEQSLEILKSTAPPARKMMNEQKSLGRHVH
ncbi:unnamed protein product [Phytophthora lilii]|uniref:Unnamed protein product n=1 Tax=Phytophthora lilii TaxID=2077276 RepID=A0A9W6WPS1_9STRA|nr:unnamed protein product [Phytophthora lilii]